MPTVTAEAYAKINLWLTVGEKRPDGYHDIESVMQQISLCDLVSVTRNPAEGRKKISVHCSDPAIPSDGRNIVWKCAEAFFEACGIDEYDVFIDIEKHIPSSAGLAGGSADGAATLLLLNERYRIHAPQDVLLSVGGKIGADIPFCLTGGMQLCRGKGEILEPLCPSPDLHRTAPLLSCAAVIVKSPALSVSTAEAYRMLDETPPSAARQILREEGFAQLREEIRRGEIPGTLCNDFERIAPREVFRLKEKLLSLGAVSALMSGSGPSVFGLFPHITAAEAVRDALLAEGYGAWAVRFC